MYKMFPLFASQWNWENKKSNVIFILFCTLLLMTNFIVYTDANCDLELIDYEFVLFYTLAFVLHWVVLVCLYIVAKVIYYGIVCWSVVFAINHTKYKNQFVSIYKKMKRC